MGYRICYGGKRQGRWKWALLTLAVLAAGMVFDRGWYMWLARYVGGCIRAVGG